MGIISYSFFEPKIMHQHRFWDKFKDEKERYWYNIPALVIVNNILYPEFKVRIHISENIKESELYPLLKDMESENLIDLVQMDYEYSNTEPTVWRYKPIFEKSSEIVLCRDIDSLPTSDEYLSTKYFIKNEEFYINTIRSHTNHTTPSTIMLAGLCGFRPNKFNTSIDFNDFYKNVHNSSWGVDQNIIINMFASNKNITEKRFLDSPLSNKLHNVGNPIIKCVSKRKEFYRTNVSLEEDKNDILKILDDITIWSGEPVDSRNKLNEILSLNFDICRKVKDIIIKNEKIKEFYKL